VGDGFSFDSVFVVLCIGMLMLILWRLVLSLELDMELNIEMQRLPLGLRV
jgi:hypothetical protein